jgi:acetyl esterase/lipase
VFTPRDRTEGSPLIYWLHGGGLVFGTRYLVYEALDLATAVGAVVVSIEYRLAPEHPVPAPGDDCLAGIRWAAAHASDLGCGPDRLVLGGTSAGAGLAAATALRLRDEGDRIGTDDVSAYDAPARATDLSNLPPTFIDVGSADLFRDEDVAFASTMWAGGGDCELHVWPGGYHGFQLLAPTCPLAQALYQTRRAWLTRVLARTAN